MELKLALLTALMMAAHASAISLVEQIRRLNGENPAILETMNSGFINQLSEKEFDLERKESSIQSENLLKFFEETSRRKLQGYKDRAEEIKYEELPYNFDKGCQNDDDCIDGTFCYPVDEALKMVLEAYGHQSEYELIARKTRITGNECVKEFTQEFFEETIDEVFSLLASLKQKITKHLETAKVTYESKGINMPFFDTSFLEREQTTDNVKKVASLLTTTGFNMTTIHDAPTIRQLQSGLDIDPMMLILLSLRGSSSVDINDILMLMIMSGSGASGDSSLTSNPLLLMMLLDDMTGNSAELLVMLSILDPTGNLLSNPLLLITLLNDASTGSSTDLLPLLILSSRLGGADSTAFDESQQNSKKERKRRDANEESSVSNNLFLLAMLGADGESIDPAYLWFLLQDNSEASFDELLPLLIAFGGGSNSNNPSSLLLLMQLMQNQDSTEGGTTNNVLSQEDLLPFLLMGGNVNPLLLTFLLNNADDNADGNVGGISDLSSDDLLPYLLLSSSSGNPMQLILLLQIMQGENAESFDTDDLLPLLLLSSGSSSTGGAINPILLMQLLQNTENANMNDLLLPLLLSSGGRDMSSVLPLLILMENTDGSDPQRTTLLFVLMNMQATSTGTLVG